MAEKAQPRRYSYSVSYWLAWACTIALGMLAATQAASGDLALTRQQTAILGILGAGLGIANSLLPRVTKPPSDDRKGLD
jgi:energy-converting hydrogenase Eha subunit A